MRLSFLICNELQITCKILVGEGVAEDFLILAPGGLPVCFFKGLVIGLIKRVKGLIIELVHTGRQVG